MIAVWLLLSVVCSAHVGIGIEGLEGKQAVMASDYSSHSTNTHGEETCTRPRRMVGGSLALSLAPCVQSDNSATSIAFFSCMGRGTTGDFLC